MLLQGCFANMVCSAIKLHHAHSAMVSFRMPSQPDSKPLAVLLYVIFCQTICFAWEHLVTVQDMGALS